MKISTFLTHKLPHLDEIFVYWALVTLQAEKCCKKVAMRFWDSQEQSLKEALADEGTLVVGIKGAKLDEHPTDTQPAKEDECAATLAARDFGIDEMPELKRLLNYIAANDTKGTGSSFDLASGLRVMYKHHSDDPMSAIKWAMDAFDAFYAEEKEFSMALAHFRAKAKVEDVRIDNRTSIKMATIESDNMSLNRCSRFLGVSILVQRTSTGNVQIHTAKGEVPILDDVARVLRLKEQQANGGINVTDWATLAREGEVDGIREWYYFRRGNLLLNGSLTTPKPPTRLSLDEIRETVRMCLSLDMFERSRYRDCAAGRCTSSRANPCRWYGYGLNRCRGVRRETYATR